MQPKYRQIEKPLFNIREEDPDIIHHFIDVNKTLPSVYQQVGIFVYEQWIDAIKRTFKQHLITWKFEVDDYKQVVIQAAVGDQVLFFRSGRTSSVAQETYILTDEQKKYVINDKISMFMDYEIFYNIRCGVPDETADIANGSKLEVQKELPKIHIIALDPEDGLYIRSMPVRRNDVDLDVHYGKGMQTFHDKQIERIGNTNKGIIIFHGPPGTGKTTYIMRVVHDLANKNKLVIYMPNSMVDMLGSPTLNNFLLDQIGDFNGPTSILIIIEDGERVLLNRKNNPGTADTVSNILNSTDGILNNFLNIQILVTFNSDLKNIDSAVLRKKRAISVKEFGPLSVVDAQNLFDHKNHSFIVKSPMTLAEIYHIIDGHGDEDDILFEEENTNNRSSTLGFR